MIGFPGGFTVLMAVYRADSVRLFLRAVESVYANRLRPDHFVLVVDGPIATELDAAITEVASRHRLEVLRLAENRGLAEALNAGLQQVRTEWVVRADADDWNLPDRFERQAEVVTDGLDLMGGAILETDQDAKPVAIRRTPTQHEDIVRYARARNPFNHMTVAFRTRLARECGGYPVLRLREDYGLWALMLHRDARTMNLPTILVHATAGLGMYRRRGGLRYARDEFQLQRHLVRCGLKGPVLGAFHAISRAVVFLLPAAVRGLIYRRVLRH